MDTVSENSSMEPQAVLQQIIYAIHDDEQAYYSAYGGKLMSASVKAAKSASAAICTYVVDDRLYRHKPETKMTLQWLTLENGGDPRLPRLLTRQKKLQHVL